MTILLYITEAFLIKTSLFLSCKAKCKPAVLALPVYIRMIKTDFTTESALNRTDFTTESALNRTDFTTEPTLNLKGFTTESALNLKGFTTESALN